MTENLLLKYLFEQIDQDRLSAANYSIEPRVSIIPNITASLIEINGIKRLAKYGVITEDYDYTDFGEMFINSYVKELVDNLGLQRGKYESGPHPSWGGNWLYKWKLEPEVSCGGDFDLDKDWLRLDITSQESLHEKILQKTSSFMDKLGISRKLFK